MTQEEGKSICNETSNFLLAAAYDNKYDDANAKALRYKLLELEEYIDKLNIKANKFNDLDKEVSKFYCDVTGEPNEDNPERKGDLGDIGEVAASALGWL